MRRKYSVLFLFFIVAFSICFICCKKKTTSPNNTTNNIDKKSIAGSWLMKGTDKLLSVSFGSHNDSVTITMTIFKVDDSIIIVQTNSDFNVYMLDKTISSPITYRSLYITYRYGHDDIYYDSIKDSLSYSYAHTELGYYEFKHLSSSKYEKLPSSHISSNVVKMTGLKQWTGTVKTKYLVPPLYTGVPRDTFINNVITLQIDAVSDTLLLFRNEYGAPYFFWLYRVLRKMHEDASSVIFSIGGNDPNETITYFPKQDSMFFYDSSTIDQKVLKYHTP